MEADFNVRIRGMMDEAYAAGEGGLSAGEFAQGKGVPGTFTDADAAGMTMKMDGEGDVGYNGGQGNKDVLPDALIRGDDMPYSEKRPNGISKSHLTSEGDLAPANIKGQYKGRMVTVAEHILGGYRKGAKGNSPYTSFTYEDGIVTNYGNNVIQVNLKEIIDDIVNGKLKGVEVLTPSHVQAAILSDVQLNDYWRNLAIKWTRRDNEWLIKGMIPRKYLTIMEDA